MDWRIMYKSSLERRKHLMESSLWSDCVFLVGRQKTEFKAHKLLLSMASPVFERQLQKHGYNEMSCCLCSITVEDIEPDAFEMMLQYIYTESVEIRSYHHAKILFGAALKFQLKDLEDICQEKLEEHVSAPTACNLLEFANKVGIVALQETAKQLISFRTMEILRAPSFLQINVSTLKEILDMDSLDVPSELELCNAVLSWAKEKAGGHPLTTDALRGMTDGAVSKLRLLTLSPQQLAASVVQPPLVTEAELLTLFMHVCLAPAGDAPVVSVAVPETLSPNRKPRARPN